MKTLSKAELSHIFVQSLSQCPSGCKEPICSTTAQVGESCCVQMCPTPPLYHSRPAALVSRTNKHVHGTPVPEGSRWLNHLIPCLCPLPGLCRCCFHSQLSEVEGIKKSPSGGNTYKTKLFKKWRDFKLFYCQWRRLKRHQNANKPIENIP